MTEGGKTVNNEVNWHVASIREGEETLSVLFPAEAQVAGEQNSETVQANVEE